jgi:hypothetical protein
MRIDCALLCDAATVREGLLNILSGGITRANRTSYPAPLGMVLALRIMIHPTEISRPHQLRVLLQDADGRQLAAMEAEIGIGDPGQIEPGEEASLPLPLGLPPQVALPAPGRYSFEILIDGTHQATVPFTATLARIHRSGGPRARNLAAGAAMSCSRRP